MSNMNQLNRDDVDAPIHDAILQGSNLAASLEEIAARPHRNSSIHWAAFLLSLVSVALLAVTLSSEPGSVRSAWITADVVLSVAFVFEFFTRSGFRWSRGKYVASRFFDFFAMVPALILVQEGVPLAGLWVWIVLAARVVRAIDRLLGDGFVRRNALALAEGFEEEITDRVLLRIVNNLHENLSRGRYGTAMAGALTKNKDAVMARIHSKTPGGGVGRFLGIDKAINKAEEGVYDAVLEILSSPEVNKAIHESIDAAFHEMRKEMGVRTWRKHIGIKR